MTKHTDEVRVTLTVKLEVNIPQSIADRLAVVRGDPARFAMYRESVPEPISEIEVLICEIIDADHDSVPNFCGLDAISDEDFCAECGEDTDDGCECMEEGV